MSQPRPQVLGVEITPGTQSQILNAIRRHLRDGIGILHVVTANPEYVMTARKDPLFARAIKTGGVVTVDGAGLAVAMRWLHPNVKSERYTGVQFTRDCALLSAETGKRIFLLGAGPGVAEEAGRQLLQQYPNAMIVGSWADGSPSPDQDDETIRRIRETDADILLVAYGAPGQICWIDRNLVALELAGVRVVAGIGGALDYISGNVPYAPSWIRKIGMEWLYRLAKEPRRWRRQLVLPHFAALVLAETVRSKRRGGVE